jgi:hypothetical protein
MKCFNILSFKSLVNDMLLKECRVSKPRGLVFTNLLYQYNETNVIHLSFSLLRIKGLCMFRALFAHPQEALHKRHLAYCVRIMQFHCNHATANSLSSFQHPIYCT